MDGVDHSSSSADDSSSDEDVGDVGAKKRRKKAALRRTDIEELEGIGAEDGDEDGAAAGGKVCTQTLFFFCAVGFALLQALFGRVPDGIMYTEVGLHDVGE